MQIKLWFGKLQKFIEESKRWLRALRNPCKKCLVQATCQHRSICKLFDDHQFIEEFREMTIIFICAVGGISFLVSTFVLGFYQWYKIIKSIFI